MSIRSIWAKNMRNLGKFVLVVCLATLALQAQTPTFNNEVVRIFQAQCQSCHHPGDIGPFSLMDYRSARPWARSIQEQVALGKMPPWKPARGVGEFQGERILSQQERDAIIKWVDAGAPEGDAKDLPAPQTFPDGWALGQPDLVLKLDQAYPVPAAGNDIYRCFSLPTNLPSDSYISAVQIRPGNRSVVHHVILYSDPLGRSKTLDDGEPGAGYTCFGGPGFTPDITFFAGWAPGIRPAFLNPGTAMQLPRGSRIAMQIHYHPFGQDTNDTSEVGIYLSKSPVDKIVRVLPLINDRFTIPAGEARYKVSAATPPIPFATHITSIAPHMHLLGKQEQVRLVSGSTTTPLIDIPDWDFQWQGIYDYRVPVAAAAGARAEMDCYFDNSANNPLNPNSPPKPVSWGEQTTDEMAVVFLGFTIDIEHLISPTSSADGVVNAASFQKGTTAPGAILSLFGIGLGSHWEQASSVPLPRSLANRTKVTIGGVDVPLFYASPSQINFQVPFEASGATTLVVTRGDDSKTVSIPLLVGEAQPGIFATPLNAARGQVLVLYATGLGRVNPTVNTGEAATGEARTANRVTVNVGGRDVEPEYAGLAPGFVGLYQVNVRIPSDVAVGDLPLKLKVAGIESNVAQVAVK